MSSTTNTFTGSVIQTVLTSRTVPTNDVAGSGGNTTPPPPLTNNFGLPLSRPFVPTNPLDLSITWDTTNPRYPQSFNGISINQLKTLISNGTIPANSLQIQMRYNVLSGIQKTTLSNRPTLTLYTWDTTGNPNNEGTENDPNTRLDVVSLGFAGVSTGVPYCLGNQCPSSPFADISNYSSGGIFVNPMPWNNGSPKTNFDITSLTLEIEFRIVLTVTCGGTDLTKQSSGQNAFCPAFCLQNLKNCYVPYLSYCFANSGTNPPISNNVPCQTYFQTYVGQFGPEARLDNNLTNYCTTKYPGGFEDLVLKFTNFPY